MKLYGKDAQIAYFKAALRKNTVGHLYIFEGAVGMGKKTLCRHVAEMLLCEGENKPCGTCSTCIKTKSGNHPDIIYVETAEKTSLSVERARTIVAEMYVKPFLAERKIYIFPDGEKLSPAVQNTLLKAFEEPPPYVTILMTATSREALLNTVVSRAIVLPLDGCNHAELCAFLCENYPARREDAPFLAKSAGGSIGTAKSLAENEGYLSMRAALFSHLPRLASSRSGVYSLVRCFEEYESALPDMLTFFSSWMRDCICMQLTDTYVPLNGDYQKEIAEFAFSVSPYAAVRCHEKALALAASIGKGSNFSVWITDFLSECWRYCHDTDSRRQI